MRRRSNDPLRDLLNVSPSSINEGGQSEKTGVQIPLAKRFLHFTLRRTFMSRGKKRWRNYAWDVRCGSLNSDKTGAYATLRPLRSSRPLWRDEACSCPTDNPQLSLL